MFSATVYRVLIASPCDVATERQEITEAIYDWNACHSAHMQVVLLPVKWETHSTPEMGDRPQAILNRQIVEPCDILIGVFSTRIGTPTGVAKSGTIEEIEHFMNNGKHVLPYFSTMPMRRGFDIEQLRLLEEFKARCQKNSIYREYESHEQLREAVSKDLMAVVRRIHKVESPNSDSLTPEQIEILCCLQKYEDEYSMYPSDEEMAIDSGKPLSDLRYNLSWLENNEYIEGIYVMGSDTLYHLLFKGREILHNLDRKQ